MNKMNAEWEQITSKKRKHKGCIFIRVKNTWDNFVLKVYGGNQAQEVADTICQEHNEKLRGRIKKSRPEKLNEDCEGCPYPDRNCNECINKARTK